MLSWPDNIRVFVCTTPTDMGKQFDGLHALVTQVFGRDVFDGHLFLFFNRRRDLATNDDLDELLPDLWKRAHPEAVLKFLEDERRQVDDSKEDRRERRRREKQLSQKLQSDKRRVNSG